MKQLDWQQLAAQDQFLEVIDRNTAMQRFLSHLRLEPLGSESVLLSAALGRILAEDVLAEVDVPAFDRSNVDGFAVQATDTFGAMDETTRRLRLNDEVLSPGIAPQHVIESGTATTIATGGMVPRGADAVVMVEHTELSRFASEDAFVGRPLLAVEGYAEYQSETGKSARPTLAPDLIVRRPVTAGQNITFAGTDIARGETVLRRGIKLTSREIGVLAAIGRANVEVYRKPRVAILSTGDEIVLPGEPTRPGAVFDSNGPTLAAAVEELGGEAVYLGVVPDDLVRLTDALNNAMQYDAVLLSGGTSKGAGDLSYRVVRELRDPGIVAHGVALKPGKPICMAVTNGKPVVILPGFPTSALFTFHEFVAPVLRAFAGVSAEQRETVCANLPLRVNSERGRTEFLLVSLVRGASEPTNPKRERGRSLPNAPASQTLKDSSPSAASALADASGYLEEARDVSPHLAAYPMGKGSGSVTTFSQADGFITIGQHTEQIEAGSEVEVTLLGRSLEPADLVVIGSHCVGLDLLLGELHRHGLRTKSLYVGSTGGLTAAKRAECDIAGMHLLDAATDEYNRPFLTNDLRLLVGYRRMQGIVFRPGDARFEGRSLTDAVAAALNDSQCTMVNRNVGSGTRILIDQLLSGTALAAGPMSANTTIPPAASAMPLKAEPVKQQPAGYAVQAKSHNAVAAAVAQGRADWGVAIDSVAKLYGLSFIPLREEHYDFAIPVSRWDRPAVARFRNLLADETIRSRLREIGFVL
ncbi:MAG: molybdopterin biosynthesis protein [Planctomycetia bacterium]|nr:molybdopterin biosynthesis protein [Planctomycetia bacterium]